MSKIKQFLTEIKHMPHDERTDRVRDNASWYGILSLFVSFLAVTAIYGIKGVTVPWSAIALFYVPLIVFTYFNLTREGYHFFLPGMAETEETLNQPAVIRSVPWLIIVQGLVGIVGIISSMIGDLVFHHGLSTFFPESSWFIWMNVLVISVITLFLNFAWAKQIKQGNSTYIKLMIIFSGLSLLQAILLVMHRAPFLFGETVHVTGMTVFMYLTTAWIFFVLVRYRKQITEAGKSYAAIKSQQKKFRWWQILIAAVLGLVLAMVLIGGFIGYTILSVLTPQKDRPVYMCTTGNTGERSLYRAVNITDFAAGDQIDGVTMTQLVYNGKDNVHAEFGPNVTITGTYTFQTVTFSGKKLNEWEVVVTPDTPLPFVTADPTDCQHTQGEPFRFHLPVTETGLFGQAKPNPFAQWVIDGMGLDVAHPQEKSGQVELTLPSYQTNAGDFSKIGGTHGSDGYENSLDAGMIRPIK